MKLIKLNDNTFEIEFNDVSDLEKDEYIDKEIFYGGDYIAIVCTSEDISIQNYYKRLLIRESLKEARNEVLSLNKDLCKANEKYIKLLEKLVD